MLDVAFRKGMTLDSPTTSSQEGKGFHPHRRNTTQATSYATMASLVRQPMALASNATVAQLAHNQGGHRWSRHHDTTSTSPHPFGRPLSRPPRWPSSGRRRLRACNTPTASEAAAAEALPPPLPVPGTAVHAAPRP
jgi:hypothetical protein